MALSHLRLSVTFVALMTCSLANAQEAPKPGPEHAELKALEGTWDCVMKAADGTDAKGSCVYKMECGGFWLTSNFTMDFGGMPFQGKGMDGYDPVKKKYVALWVDSMSPMPMIFEGGYDAKKEKLTMTADGPGPDGKPAKWRSVTVHKDKDHQTFDMFVTAVGGQEQKMMTIEYTRKK